MNVKKWCEKYWGNSLLQSNSSEPSGQSKRWSQRRAASMHVPSSHMNSDSVHSTPGCTPPSVTYDQHAPLLMPWVHARIFSSEVLSELRSQGNRTEYVCSFFPIISDEVFCLPVKRRQSERRREKIGRPCRPMCSRSLANTLDEKNRCV